MPILPRQQQAEWVRLFRERGEKHYFEKLYESTRRAVFARCLKILRDASQAEDATHETFIRAFERFRDFQGENFLAWATSIATHICLNRLRHYRTRQRLEPFLVGVAEAPEQPDRKLSRKRRVQQMEKVLETLGNEQRKVLLLKYLEGYTYAEIVKVTGFDKERIRSLLQNGKRNFRLRWEEIQGDARSQ